MADKKMLVVVQYEQFFDLGEDIDLPEAMKEGLEVLRSYGGARVVGSYEVEDTQKFRQGAVDFITVKAPITFRVD